MDAKRKKMNAQIELIRNFGANTNKAGSANITVGFLNGRRELLDKYWSKFVDQYNAIADHDSTMDFESCSDFADTELLYSIALGELNDYLVRLTPSTSTSSPLQSFNNSVLHNRSLDVKLPRINIPSFSGDYGSWTSFCDIFSTLVINNALLSNVQKLYHLKASISGEASVLLRHFAVTENNFQPAWDLLKRRYANKRLLLSAQFDKLLSQAKLNSSSASGLKRILDTTLECMHGVANLVNAEARYETLLLHIITQKLDFKTHEAWELSIRGSEEPESMDNFIKFLEESCRTMELVAPPKASTSEQRSLQGNRARQADHRSVNSHHSSTNSSIRSSKPVCPVCKQSHMIYSCQEFKDMSLEDRSKFVTQEKLCTACLSPTHSASNCTSKRSCVVCNQHHNTLLHSSRSGNPFASSNPQPQSSSSTEVVHTHHLVSRQERQALLATALIRVHSSSGRWYTFRALLDQGSQATFITQSAVSTLHLPMIKINTSIRGLGNTCTGVSKHMSSFSIKSMHNDIVYPAEAIVLPNLTSLLPSSHITLAAWPHIEDLQLADPQFYKPSKIDLVIGADLFADILMAGVRKGPLNTPVAQETTLGWILSGRLGSISPHLAEPCETDIISCLSNVTLSEQLQQFWKIEEIVDAPQQSDSDRFCENHFQNTHIRSTCGTYTVRLPFDTNDDFPEFGFSFKKALSRLHQMEKRFERNPELKEQYNAFMQEYLSLGHMHPISKYSEADLKSFFLPHHAVFKSSSTTTKTRVVFDASCKSSTGISLNDRLLAGPILQQGLMEIMMRWRKHRVAITADVEKMFRQISVASDHQPYQRILWRDDCGKLTVYELNTVTYGTACAPFLSIRVMRQLAEDEKQHFSMAYDRTMTDMYVDDLISGGDTTEEAIALQRETIEMFQRGGFTLRKWASNQIDVVRSVPENYRELASSLDIGKDNAIKTLGILWRPETDTFFFKVNLPTDPLKTTKRSLLSDVSRIYDPLGWLAPVVVRAKIIFQDLWLRGLEWDEPLPNDIADEWTTLRTNLVVLESLSIPRWIHFSPTIKSIEYHGFCDASLKAYAAVIYCRIDDGIEVKVTLLTAKTRVAPLKQISLPNLELCGAALLAKLIDKVTKAMTIPNSECYAWTDSTIVLSWLKNNTHKKVFVANRISSILDYTLPHQWSHVRSAENPADVASRGICPTKFKEFNLWWNGPAWLSEDKSKWRHHEHSIENNDIETEIISNTTIIQPNETAEYMLNKFSTLQKLLRVTALCLRFARNCRQSHIKLRETSFISASEIRATMNIWIKYAQTTDFSQDIAVLSKSTSATVASNSRLLCLNPFLCDNGFLRVGGRLQNSSISFDSKHPILLDRRNAFTKLVIQRAHVDTTLHGGGKLTLAAIRDRFWIINARSAIRSCIKRCVVCHRHSAITKSQIMAALPQSRVTPSKIFSHTGVDYAGPFDVRLSKHRGRGTMKAYVCMFVCFATKAVHIELVSDMTSENFIAAFKRFVARRGTCSDLYSDCGTNFVGANKLLVNQYHKAESTMFGEIGQSLANHDTQWHFISPGSPHFGGLWEASVKSFKHHLKRIVGNAILTYEELYTALTQIEATLNSRPLCPLSNDPNDICALTPGHFLVGCPLIAVPQPSLLEAATNRLSRWQLIEKIHQDLWQSWTRDYLHELHQRPRKWSKERDNICIGDMVLVKDDRTAPGLWPLARVVDVHPGSDGKVRVATIRHKAGTTKRPIVKLSLLPIKDPEISDN